MARIELAPKFGDDRYQIAHHLLDDEVTGIEPRLHGIVIAIEELRANPLIGRPMGQQMREMLIGRGSHGYVALYRYVAAVDTVFELAIRAQREGSYASLRTKPKPKPAPTASTAQTLLRFVRATQSSNVTTLL